MFTIWKAVFPLYPTDSLSLMGQILTTELKAGLESVTEDGVEMKWREGGKLGQSLLQVTV